MRKISVRLFATALVALAVLCATTLNSNFTSANYASMGHAVLAQAPSYSVSTLEQQAGWKIWGWKIWDEVGAFAEKVAKPVGVVAGAVVGVTKAISAIKAPQAELAAPVMAVSAQIRANMLLTDLDD